MINTFKAIEQALHVGLVGDVGCGGTRTAEELGGSLQFSAERPAMVTLAPFCQSCTSGCRPAGAP
jgi:hypothetical protein